MTVVLESSTAAGAHRAYTGVKGIVLPFASQASLVQDLAPELYAAESTPMERLGAVRRLEERIRERTVSSASPSEEREIREELDHFDALSSSSVAMALFHANRVARWNLSHAWRRRSANDPPWRPTLGVIRYLSDAHRLWRAAYPLLEAHHLARNPSDPRIDGFPLDATDAAWHPMATETVRLASDHGDSLKACDSIRLGQLVDHGFRAGVASASLLGSRTRRMSRFATMGDLLELVLPRLGAGSLRVLASQRRLAWRSRRFALSTAGGPVARRRLPMWLVAGATFDPSVYAAGLPTHKGLDASLPRERKVALDLWWNLLRAASEGRFLLESGFDLGDVRALVPRRLEFYAAWGQCARPESIRAVAVLGDALQRVVMLVANEVLEGRAVSDRGLARIAHAEFMSLSRRRWFAAAVSDSTPAKDELGRTIRRILNAGYHQI